MTERSPWKYSRRTVTTSCTAARYCESTGTSDKSTVKPIERHGARHDGSVFTLPANFHRSADHVRAIVHDPQAHSVLKSERFRKWLPVVSDCERQFLAAVLQVNVHSLGFAVLDRVCYGFLSDLVELLHHVLRQRGNVASQVQFAIQLEHTFGMPRQLP